MERHERYDPEDIESLLSERGFDELLPDERAFVLRHMSGRDEYERMRALLHYVRPDERERGTIEPDERVRRNVMAAFRAQQQAQWRIWLNSIMLWLVPREAGANWRPALAFGSLALLIVAGVVAVRQFNGTTTEHLAELKHPEKVPAPSIVKETTDRPELQHDNGATIRGVEAERSVTTRSDASEAPTPAREPVDVAKAYSAEPAEDHAANAAEYVEQKFQPGAPATGVVAEPSGSLSHVVSADELSRNMSTTNAVGEVSMQVAGKKADRRHKAVQQTGSSRSMADDPGILGLVAAGW